MTDREPARPLVKCPNCRRQVEWDPDNPWRPFCSERCKMADLGAWINEERRIPDDGLPPEDSP